MKKLLCLMAALLLLSGCAATYDGPTTTKRVCTLQETEVFNADGSHSQWHREEYSYDIYGNKAQILESYNGTPCYKMVMRYNEAGRETRQVQYDLSGWFPQKIVDVRYAYDEQGRLISTTHRSGGLFWDDDATVYDDAAMTRTYTGYDGTVTDYLNDQGWVLRSLQTHSDGSTVLTEYDRSSDGALLASRSYEDGVLSCEVLYTYDDRGRILTQTEVRDGVSTLLFAWEYAEDRETMY